MKISDLQKCKILICVGSGGVGKTTLAASLAVAAASAGLNTLVLTIDPSLRLAQALGIQGKTENTLVPGQNFKGRLSAAIVDHKTVFNDFVKKASSKQETVARIFKNKLYQQLTTSLSGSQEFTALEKLYQAYESNEFDLIILDTPPAQHAIDFLNAPQKLAALFSEGVAQWFRDPKGQKKNIFVTILNTGTRQVIRALETLTGAQFIHELSDFFSLIENWQTKLHDRTVLFHKLLVSPMTHFALVTSFEEAKLKEAEVFSREISKSGYNLRHVFLNRSYPEWTYDESRAEGLDPTQRTEIKRLADMWKKYYSNRAKIFEHFRALMPSDVQTHKVADFVQPISNLEGLKFLSTKIIENES